MIFAIVCNFSSNMFIVPYIILVCLIFYRRDEQFWRWNGQHGGWYGQYGWGYGQHGRRHGQHGR